MHDQCETITTQRRPVPLTWHFCYRCCFRQADSLWASMSLSPSSKQATEVLLMPCTELRVCAVIGALVGTLPDYKVCTGYTADCMSCSRYQCNDPCPFVFAVTA